MEAGIVRKIIHIDMDAFFASVEQRDDVNLRNKPVAVGGSAERGVVAAASYEARKYGVRSAMPSRTAKRLCPNLIFVRPRFDVYKEVSDQIRGIFSEFTDLIEPLSLDEAYLDVTHNKIGLPSATLIAKEIRKRILEQTGLTASAGISINKFLAKTASDVNKPNGQFLIPPEDAEAYVDTLPIERFFGIGKVTADKMRQMGIFFGKDLKQYSREDLVIRFGKAGHYYYQIARAIDERPVNPNRIRKSIGAENTFSRDLVRITDVEQELKRIAGTVSGRMKRSESAGKTLTLKVKFDDFTVITRSKTIHGLIENEQDILDLIPTLLEQAELEKFRIRLLGLSVSHLNTEEEENEPVADTHGVQLTLSF
ncbi:DNA polymerase IV [Fulvivirga sedimenti]|uniref:DNA polymerase IV n=1 Tax=Fulvivirga sedimenti TaxID=2879465 RepID=A0A9X1L1Z1_9BACT|nr:DNA polymerase IV [Fulvivirga sedimenti]MCA6078752.1 DNA polymerase IV [Fulvivirga sedimenti]